MISSWLLKILSNTMYCNKYNPGRWERHPSGVISIATTTDDILNFLSCKPTFRVCLVIKCYILFHVTTVGRDEGLKWHIQGAPPPHTHPGQALSRRPVNFCWVQTQHKHVSISTNSIWSSREYYPSTQPFLIVVYRWRYHRRQKIDVNKKNPAFSLQAWHVHMCPFVCCQTL
jgi:hypothetical protein